MGGVHWSPGEFGGGMSMIPVDSSSIRCVGYEGGHLYVQFHGKDEVYDHPGVSFAVFQQFMNASSMGAFYNQHIRGRYG